MRKFLTLILMLGLCFTASACGGADESGETVADVPAETQSPASSLPEAEAKESVEVTLPASYAEGATQESLDASLEKNGYESATLNGDGSVTFVMSQEKHRELLAKVAEQIDSAVAGILSENENIVSISPTDDYSTFDVIINTDSVPTGVALSALEFYAYGGMYAVYAGTDPEAVKVNYINESSGEIIETASAKDFYNN